jgi:hypothetical protein
MQRKYLENKRSLENDILDALDFDTAEINTVSVEKRQTLVLSLSEKRRPINIFRP